MPRYFFDCQCDGRSYEDGFGADMEHDEIADHALQLALELMRDIDRVSEPSEIKIQVRGGDGRKVYVFDGHLSGAYTTEKDGIRPDRRRCDRR